LSNHKKFKLSFFDYFYTTKKSTSAGKGAYNEQYLNYESVFIPQLKEELNHNEQDFQQIFVLHVNECYKNLFLTNIRKVIFMGVLASSIISTITLSTSYLLTKDIHKSLGLHKITEKDSDLTVSWKSEDSRKY